MNLRKRCIGSIQVLVIYLNIFFPLDTKRVLPKCDCVDVNDHVLCHFHRVYFSFERL